MSELSDIDCSGLDKIQGDDEIANEIRAYLSRPDIKRQLMFYQAVQCAIPEQRGYHPHHPNL